MNLLRKLYRQYRRRQAIKNIRELSVMLGRDLSQFSDDDIELGLIDFYRRFREINSGITLSEASEAMRKLAIAAHSQYE